MKVINNKDFSEELDSVCSFYRGETDAAVLKTHLQTLSVSIHHERDSTDDGAFTFEYLKSFMGGLIPLQKSLLSEVVFVYKIILLAPATNAVSE